MIGNIICVALSNNITLIYFFFLCNFMISSINLVGGDDAIVEGLSFCPVATTSGHWTETKPIVKYWDIAFETPLLEL